MKKRLLLTFIPFIVLTGLIQSCGNKIIELPLTYEKGYGPFYPSMGALSFRPYDENSPWAETMPEYSGIPVDWTETVVTTFQFDMAQFVYQNYKFGHITEEYYKDLKASWDWLPDETELYDIPIKCFVGIVRGKNAQGEIQYIVDADNDLDFSNNEPITLSPQPQGIKPNEFIAENKIPVKYERIFEDQVKEEETYLIMRIMEKMSNVVFANNAEYATVTLDGQQLGLVSSNFGDMAFHRPTLAVIPPDLPEGEYIDINKTLQKSEYLVLKNNIYQIIGVDRNRDVLIMEKMRQQRKKLESSQPGFKPFPVSGKDFTTNDTINLKNYTGKYVFVDFWATWCSPCIGEFPDLKEIYKNTDRSEFEILGIVGDSRAEDLLKSINQHHLTWPQLLSTDDNPIVKTYRINAYPTTLLIGPDGIIIDRDLRGDKLKDKLKELKILK